MLQSINIFIWMQSHSNAFYRVVELKKAEALYPRPITFVDPELTCEEKYS